jgi:hypothetical protein
MCFLKKLRSTFIHELKEFINFHSIVYADHFEAINLREDNSKNFIQQNILVRNKYLKYTKASSKNFYRKLFSENTIFVFLQLLILLLKHSNSQYAIFVSEVSYNLFYSIYILNFLIAIFEVFKTEENREIFFHNLKKIFWDFIKKLLMLKIIHILFNKIIKSLPNENQPYFLDNLSKVKENTQDENPRNIKNYFYIVVGIFITVSAVTLLYKNRWKIGGFLRKTFIK